MSNAETAAAPSAVVIHRTFNVPRERVFAAWTTPELLMQWFGPPGVEMTGATFDARLGGRFRLAMNSTNGEPLVVGGTITEFRPPERLAFSFRWEEDDPADERDTSVRIDFVARGAATEMIFVHDGFASEASRNGHNGGWNGGFGKLSDLLSPSAPIAIRGIDLSGYMCKDAKRAISFYRDLFGLEPSLVYPDDRGAEFELPDGTTFGLWGGGGKVMPFQPSNGILFAVDDLTASIAALEARGIGIVHQFAGSRCRMAMISDTEGNLVTLHQRMA